MYTRCACATHQSVVEQLEELMVGNEQSKEREIDAQCDIGLFQAIPGECGHFLA